MTRSAKLAVALAVAVLLHAAIVLFSLAPGVQGLTAEVGAAPAGTNAEMPPKDQALEVGWTEPVTPLPAPPPPQPEAPPPEPKPAPKPVPKPAPKLEAKPDPKPEARTEPKPAPKIAVAAAAPPPTPAAVPKPATPGSKPAAAAIQSAAATTPGRQGSGSASSAVTADVSYANQVRQHLARFAGELPPGASGEARVQFVVLLDGRVDELRLVQRSGHPGLDALALDLPRRAQPMPLPGAVPQRLEVPVQAAAAP